MKDRQKISDSFSPAAALNDLFLTLHLGLLLAAVLTARAEALSDRPRLFVIEVLLSIFERLSPSRFRRSATARSQWEDVEGLWRLAAQREFPEIEAEDEKKDFFISLTRNFVAAEKNTR